MHYGEVTKSRESWARSLLDEFKSNVEMLKSAVRDLQGPPPGHGSPQHGKHLARALFGRTHTHRATSQWVFCPPVSRRDDLYEPLCQAAAEGVGLREVQGALEWSSHTHPSAQCCWCLQPGTRRVFMRVRTAECGGAHLLRGQWVFRERIPVVSGFLLLALSASCHLFLYLQAG